eukprot:CAMPEP_0172889958 /NCGR_PEP_ID=MMETSP1075-20121228/140103_1 /TAXON_ID=2916 /ORGANISM="Ceratium fusus, Strain PA161109" /LENGTH=70 /DNA_ID=CAMNT_0013744123 /DNA_START=207 /DNA_END=416 /DNA_ORIENTATION=+
MAKTLPAMRTACTEAKRRILGLVARKSSRSRCVTVRLLSSNLGDILKPWLATMCAAPLQRIPRRARPIEQ